MVRNHVRLDHHCQVGIKVAQLLRVGTRSQEALLFAGEEDELDVGEKADVLATDGACNGEEAGGARAVVVGAWGAERTKGAPGVVVRADEDGVV